MKLSSVYKYASQENGGNLMSDAHLYLRYETGEWKITLFHPEAGVLKFEWFITEADCPAEEITAHIEKFLDSILYDPAQVHVVICSENFNILPLGFTYDYPDSLSRLIQSSDDQVYRTETLSGFKDQELTYQVPAIVSKMVSTLLPASHITHQAIIFYKEARHKELAESIQICVYKKYALLQATVKHETFLIKRVSFETKEDLLFEIMSVYKHFSMNPMEIPLFTGGLITETSELFQLLRRYIQDVQIQLYKSFEHLHELPDLYENHLIEKV